MTEQKFYNYKYDCDEDRERVASNIEKLLNEGWLIKHFQVYTRKEYARMALVLEKNNCSKPEIK